MPSKPADALLSEFPTEVSISQLAALLGINERNTRQLIPRKIAVKGKLKSKWNFLETLHNYHASLRAAATGRADGSDGKTLATARASLADLQAEEARIRIARARGEFVPLSDVIDGWSKVAQTTRSAMLGLTSQIGFIVPHLTAHDREEIARIIRESLGSISEEVASISVLGSPGGQEFTTDKPPKAKPRQVAVKVPTKRGRPRGS